MTRNTSNLKRSEEKCERGLRGQPVSRSLIRMKMTFDVRVEKKKITARFHLLLIGWAEIRCVRW